MLLPGAGGGFGGRLDVERCAEAVAAAHAFDRLEAAAAGIKAEAERPTGSQPGVPSNFILASLYLALRLLAQAGQHKSLMVPRTSLWPC